MPILKVLWTLIIFFLTFTVKAAQLAIITQDKAIIYSDPQLTSPIGYIREGKRIYVGKVKRKHGTILPIAINGKVAWIKVSAIHLIKKGSTLKQKQGKITEHDIESIVGTNDEKNLDPLTQNNYLLLRVSHLSSPRFNTETTTPQGGIAHNFEEEEKTGKSFSLLFEHKNPYRQWHWGAGIDYMKVDSLSAKYDTLALRGNISWVPLYLSWVSIEAFSGFLFSGTYRIKINNFGRYRGYMYGLEYGLMARFFPQYRYGLALGLSSFNLDIQELDKVQNNIGDNTTALKSFSSTQLLIGLTYRF